MNTLPTFPTYPTPLADIETISQKSTIGRARVRDVLALGYAPGELFRLSRLGLVDLILAARPLHYEESRGLPLVRDGHGDWTPVEFISVRSEVLS